MNSSHLLQRATAIAIVSALAGCATWHSMDREEKGTTVGAGGGALVGAAVGGPVGALVGAGVGAYTGHYEADKLPLGSNANAAPAPDRRSEVRAAQIALSDRGFSTGSTDGVWGPSTESAVRQFQRSRGLAQTGTLDRETRLALGMTG